MKHFRVVWQKAIAVLLVFLLAAPAVSAKPERASIKEQVLMIRPGSAVEIRLTDKSKLKGRLGAVTDDGFELQALTDEKIATQQVPFDRVQSVKDKGQQSFGHSLGRGFLVAGIVIGVGIVISVVVCAASSNCGG